MSFILYIIFISTVVACDCIDCELINIGYNQNYIKSYNINNIKSIHINLRFNDGITFGLFDKHNFLLCQQGYSCYYYVDYSGDDIVCFDHSSNINYRNGLYLVLLCSNINGCVGYVNFEVSKLTSYVKYYIGGSICGGVVIIIIIFGVVYYNKRTIISPIQLYQQPYNQQQPNNQQQQYQLPYYFNRHQQIIN